MARPRHSSDESGYSLVEMLVVMALMGVVTFAVFTVVRTMVQTERYTSDLRLVMDDARASISAVRKEVRQARNVMPDSDAATLHIWVDRNQDTAIQPDENVWYCLRPVDSLSCATTGASGPGFELVRWTEPIADPTIDYTWPRTAPTDARVVARTLLSTDVFSFHRGALAVSGTDVSDATRVFFGFDFDASTASGPDTLTMASNVRLRNVDVE